MNPRIQELLERVRALEEEIEREFKRRRAELNADFEQRKVRFEQEVLAQQARFREGLLGYLVGCELRHAASMPFIYPLFPVLVLLDLMVMLYQAVCFPLYGIARVRRRDYLVFDRSMLGYLNLLEKLNCAYCSYATGLLGFLREVIARTEQYWCPIKHARRVLQAHPLYDEFLDFGDAEAYRRELRSLREALARLGEDPP